LNEIGEKNCAKLYGITWIHVGVNIETNIILTWIMIYDYYALCETKWAFGNVHAFCGIFLFNLLRIFQSSDFECEK
jgi:hypothetical protein